MFAYAKPEHKQETKSTVQKKELENTVASPNQTGIPDYMKTRFENLSGFSFDDVRVHYNSDKPAQLQALAYTQGNQVYVAPGQEKHLGHELGHVVQQKQGLVQSNTSFDGYRINDDSGLEHDADVMGKHALQRKQTPHLINEVHDNSEQPVQRYVSLLKMEYSNDFVENTSIDYALKRANEPLKLLAESDYSKMTNTDRLYLVGHGGKGTSGDYKATDIADKIINEDTGLKSNIQEIVFTSCHAGASETEPPTDTSCVGVLKGALVKKGFAVTPVKGAMGPSVKADRLGDDFLVVDPEQFGTAGALQTSSENEFISILKDPETRNDILTFLTEKNAELELGLDGPQIATICNSMQSTKTKSIKGIIDNIIISQIPVLQLKEKAKDKARFIADFTSDFYKNFADRLKAHSHKQSEKGEKPLLMGAGGMKTL